MSILAAWCDSRGGLESLAGSRVVLIGAPCLTFSLARSDAYKTPVKGAKGGKDVLPQDIWKKEATCATALNGVRRLDGLFKRR